MTRRLIRGETIVLANDVLSDTWLLTGPLPDAGPSAMRSIEPRRAAAGARASSLSVRAPAGTSRAPKTKPKKPGLTIPLPGDKNKFPEPRRITSLGNGLVLDWKASVLVSKTPYYLTGDDTPEDPYTWTPRHPRHHATCLDVCTLENYRYRYSTLWMCDDDNNYASYIVDTLGPSDFEFEPNEWSWLSKGHRPLSVVPYPSWFPPNSASDDEGPIPWYDPELPWSDNISYAAVTIADGWGEPGALVEDWRAFALPSLDSVKFYVDELAKDGFRPISIRGAGVPIFKPTEDGPVAVHMVPRFAVVFVKDNIPPEDSMVLWASVSSLRDS